MTFSHGLALAEQTKQTSTDIDAKTTKSGSQPSKWHAYLKLGFLNTIRGCVLKSCEHQGPLYVQKPFYPEGKEVAHTYLLHPPGGIVSGDSLNITVNLTQDTHVLITTPGAGRVYRARYDKSPQKQEVQLFVGPKSVLEWLPQETILYPNAQARLMMNVHLEQAAKFIGWEITCFGLPANQADFAAGQLTQNLQIFQQHRLILRECLMIDAQNQSVLSASAGLQGKPIHGLMVAGPFTESDIAPSLLTELIDVLRQYGTQHAALSGICSGVSLVGDFLIVRSLHNDSEQMKQLFTQCWCAIRPVLVMRQAQAPKIWAT